ncbi:MAG TPA: pyridoxal phosphate-dependent aminotransferase [Vicinamibacteria bacterium]|nr:pyridoxal phosphate-dependent aminotransferase [Vicinamibacteria bacterium]
MSIFSNRLSWNLEENELSRALRRKREENHPVSDLTVSNPTRAGLSYPGEEILNALARAEALVYEPSAKGHLPAREAVARYYADRGCAIHADDVVLTASTSEAYGHVFKLLCDAGDEVLVPEPSYPLLRFLAALDEVKSIAYPLRLEDGWRIDLASLASLISPRTRALVVVNPNNPTGSYPTPDVRENLLELSETKGISLIVDEVFLDYPLQRNQEIPSFAGATAGLVFVLSGLSKLAGLPQLKLAWIAIGGSPELTGEAANRLEHISDTYLSVGTPVQIAAPHLLALAPGIAERISLRTRSNLSVLSSLVPAEPSVSILPPEAGWYAPVRLPAIESSESWALRFLEEASVYVHPGAYFGFDREALVVVSLLTERAVFARGIREVLSVVSSRMRGTDG